MFSTFPGGSPGFGLLILRVALGLTTLFEGVEFLSETAVSPALNWILGFLLLTAVVFLLAGFLTPPLALTALAVGAASLVGAREAAAFEVYAVILAAAIALLGPGAFSLDARIFGRREIVIPRASDDKKISNPKVL